MTDRQRLADELAHQAGHDHLTGLANRSVLEPRLDRVLARANRSGLFVGICYIDLDHFKAVNDTLGHAVGDEILVEVADRLCGIVRAGDSSVRVGGDEFVVVLDALPGFPEIVDAARRIRDTLVAPPLRRGTLTVGASVGATLSGPEDTPRALMDRADAALYRAKAQGGSAVFTSTGQHQETTASD